MIFLNFECYALRSSDSDDCKKSTSLVITTAVHIILKKRLSLKHFLAGGCRLIGDKIIKFYRVTNKPLLNIIECKEPIKN
jgi:hypothetical protein